MSVSADLSAASQPAPTTPSTTPGPTRSPDWEAHLWAPLAGRKIICAFEVLAGMTGLVDSFKTWGAGELLLIADGVGAGPLPPDDAAEVIVLDSPAADSVTDQVRARLIPAQRLTHRVVEAVERFDPAGEALWWLSAIPRNTPLLGRNVWGGRPPHQVALEDKLMVDSLLADIDAPRMATLNARATYGDLARATERLLASTGAAGAVWAGDSRDGINGGADYVRWICTPEQAREAAAFFARHCDQVRVSPFLEGVPCSVHGIVLPDGVVVLRPVELAVLRDVSRGRFVYAGMGTTWDPPPNDTQAMRELARSFGLSLQDRHGYRGGFGLDGVLTTDGFRVTELNPRLSGGLSRLARAARSAQLDLVHLNALVGRDVGRPAAEIEALALEELEARRFQEAAGSSPAVHTTESETVSVSIVSGRLLELPDGAATAALGSILRGPSSVGTFVRLAPSTVGAPGELSQPAPDRAADLAVMLLDFADRAWNTQFGELTAAPDVAFR